MCSLKEMYKWVFRRYEKCIRFGEEEIGHDKPAHGMKSVSVVLTIRTDAPIRDTYRVGPA